MLRGCGRSCPERVTNRVPSSIRGTVRRTPSRRSTTSKWPLLVAPDLACTARAGLEEQDHPLARLEAGKAWCLHGIVAHAPADSTHGHALRRFANDCFAHSDNRFGHDESPALVPEARLTDDPALDNRFRATYQLSLRQCDEGRRVSRYRYQDCTCDQGHADLAHNSVLRRQRAARIALREQSPDRGRHKLTSA